MAADHEAEGEDSDGSSSDDYPIALYEDDVETFLCQIEDVDEDEALCMLVAWEKEQNESHDKRKTSKGNKERKQAQKKDRRVFNRGAQRGRPRLSIADLKERTKCANCGQKGHWKAKCTQPYKPREPGQETGTGGNALERLCPLCT